MNIPKDITEILLNYDQITINESLLEKCILEEKLTTRNITLLTFNNIENIASKLNLDIHELYHQIYFKNIKPTKIRICKSGILHNLDNLINLALSKYNLTISTKNIKEQLNRIENNLSNCKDSIELRKISPILYQEYQKLKKQHSNHYRTPITEKTKNIILKNIITKELETITYIKNNIDNYFKELSSCDEILDIIDLKKLNLLVAYEIMNLSEKTKEEHTIIFLKEYLKRNKLLLEQDYSIREYQVDKFGIESFKIYSIKEIYDYIYKPSKKEESSSITNISEEYYNYNFLEPNHNNPREILYQYYKLINESDDIEKRKELLKRKIAYYQTLPIISLKVGQNSFDGYLGIGLENGIIILDKFFDKLEKRKIAINDAIYITDEEEFEQITRISKTDCIDQIKQGKVKTKRLYHTKKWEENLENNTK